MKLRRGDIALGGAAGLVAGALKLHYSTTSVNGLRWMLAPTATLVELTTGETFTFEAYAGYMNADHSFLIAASCSGVNFLIAAFLLLVVLRIVRGNGSWMTLPMALAAAYVTTIIANTVRIAVALRLHRMDRDLIWVNPEQLHRVEGILIYFGFLLLLFVLSESTYRSEMPSPRDRFAWLRRTWLPLMIYWIITLGIPIVTGAYRQGRDFFEHVLFVIITPLILLLPLLIFTAIKARRTAFE